MTNKSEMSLMLGNISFRHLQVPPKCVSLLEDLGLFCARDILDCSPTSLSGRNSIVRVVNTHLSLLSKHIKGTHVHWPNFWEEDKIRLHWLAVRVPSGAFDERIRARTLESLEKDFGTLLRIPKMRGLETLGQIIDIFERGTEPWPGYGALKMKQLGTKLYNLSEGHQVLSDVFPTKILSGNNIPESVFAWDINALGIGAKSKTLRKKGYQTIGCLLNKDAPISQTRAVGSSTIKTIINHLAVVESAVVNGEFDLDMLAQIQNTKIFPVDRSLDVEKLSEVISSIISSVAEEDPSSHAESISQYRICASGSESATLSEIAEMSSEKITRERVRQIEKRILKQVFQLLTQPYPTIGKVLVRPVLKLKFSDLLERLAGIEEISPADLGLLISQVWHCSPAEAFRLLPMIIAIIEGAARNTSDLKRLGDSPIEFFQTIEGNRGHWAVQNLAAERSLSIKFSTLGILTIEDLRVAWLNGLGFGQHEEFVRLVLSVACSDSLNDADFLTALSDKIKSPIIPNQPKNWTGYFETIRHDIAEIIDHGTFWADARLIFEERTSKLPSERRTMAALGEKLNRIAVTVKRTETETLSRLALTILHNEGGYIQCLLRPDWIEFIHELNLAFSRFPNDPKMFRHSLEQSLQVDEEVITMAMPTVWALLSGKLTRKTYGKAKVDLKELKQTLAPVKLSGFRSVH